MLNRKTNGGDTDGKFRAEIPTSWVQCHYCGDNHRLRRAYLRGNCSHGSRHRFLLLYAELANSDDGYRHYVYHWDCHVCRSDPELICNGVWEIYAIPFRYHLPLPDGDPVLHVLRPAFPGYRPRDHHLLSVYLQHYPLLYLQDHDLLQLSGLGLLHNLHHSQHAVLSLPSDRKFHADEPFCPVAQHVLLWNVSVYHFDAYDLLSLHNRKLSGPGELQPGNEENQSDESQEQILQALKILGIHCTDYGSDHVLRVRIYAIMPFPVINSLITLKEIKKKQW